MGDANAPVYNNVSDMIDALLPLCYGRLNLKTVEIEEACLCEIYAYMDGWKQRYYDLDDLFIVRSSLPVYQTQCKKPPTYEDMTRGRSNKNPYDNMTLEELRALASED